MAKEQSHAGGKWKPEKMEVSQRSTILFVDMSYVPTKDHL